MLLFTRFPLESAHGGAETHTLLLAEGLRARGHEVKFLGSCPVLLDKFREGKFEVDELVIGPPPVTKWSAFSFLWRRFRMKRKLIAALSTLSPRIDTIHSSQANCHTEVHEVRQFASSHTDNTKPTTNRNGNNPLTFFMISLTEKLLLTQWLTRRRCKVIWIEHDRVGRWLTWNPWLPLLRKMSRYAQIVAVSDLSKEIYANLGFQSSQKQTKPQNKNIPFPISMGKGEGRSPQNIPHTTPTTNLHTIPNGIDLQRFLSLREKRTNCHTEVHACVPKRTTACRHEVRQFNIPNQSPPNMLRDGNRRFVSHEIGCIARLTYDKGVDLLVEAVASLPSLHLTIVGQGPEEENLKKRITALHCENRVRIIPNIVVDDFYHTIDVLVLPSREHDPFGLVVAEAMAAGIPTICTDACGIARHLPPDASIVVPAGDAEALYGALVSLMDEKIWNAHAMIGPAALERFSLNRMIDAYENLL